MLLWHLCVKLPTTRWNQMWLVWISPQQPLTIAAANPKILEPSVADLFLPAVSPL